MVAASSGFVVIADCWRMCRVAVVLEEDGFSTTIEDEESCRLRLSCLEQGAVEGG